MNCPKCPSSKLRILERRGITIETCPRCRGLWLDGGELEQLMNSSGNAPGSTGTASNSGDFPFYDPETHDPADEGETNRPTPTPRPEKRKGSKARSGDDKGNDKRDRPRKRKRRSKQWADKLGDVIEDAFEEVFD